MRILFIVPRYWPSVGGAQHLARQVVQRVSQLHQTQVVTQSTADNESFITSVVNTKQAQYYDGEVLVRRIGPRGILEPAVQALAKIYGIVRPVNPLFAILLNQSLLGPLTEIVKEFQPDIVHAVHIGLVYSSETAYAAARQQNIPFVWTPVPHIEGGGWSGKRFRRLYRAADGVIAMTGHEKQWLIEQGATPGRVHVIPAGVTEPPPCDPEWFRNKYELKDAPVVLFLGQKLPYKGYKQLSEAAPIVWQKYPETRFVFIGPRTAESVSFFASFSDRRILEIGSVDDAEKNSALAASDIFCMPSAQESLGIVYLEAWNYRKPVVGARIDALEDVIDSGIDGLLVPQKPDAIADALTQLLGDPPLRQSFGKAGYAKVRQQYDWEPLTQQMLGVYHSLLERAE